MSCPRCGYCEHCGRSNPTISNYLPYYPAYIPGPTYTYGFNVPNNGLIGNIENVGNKDQ